MSLEEQKPGGFEKTEVRTELACLSGRERWFFMLGLPVMWRCEQVFSLVTAFRAVKCP
jgi:hypothetical protein